MSMCVLASFLKYTRLSLKIISAFLSSVAVSKQPTKQTGPHLAKVPSKKALGHSATEPRTSMYSAPNGPGHRFESHFARHYAISKSNLSLCTSQGCVLLTLLALKGSGMPRAGRALMQIEIFILACSAKANAIGKVKEDCASDKKATSTHDILSAFKCTLRSTSHVIINRFEGLV